MKTIVQALKMENIRIVRGNNWMSWNDAEKEWEVYFSKELLCSTPDQKIAVDFLLGKRT